MSHGLTDIYPDRWLQAESSRTAAISSSRNERAGTDRHWIRQTRSFLSQMSARVLWIPMPRWQICSRSGKPVRLVVNSRQPPEIYDGRIRSFYNLGIGEPIPISAANRQGLGDMLDEVIKEFPDAKRKIRMIFRKIATESRTWENLLWINKLLERNVTVSTQVNHT